MQHHSSSHMESGSGAVSWVHTQASRLAEKTELTSLLSQCQLQKFHAVPN